MTNVGNLDRTIRFVLGAILLVAPFLLSFAALGPWAYVLAVMGLVMLGTATFRFCPAYTLFGIRTCPLARG